jgi:uncharacterized protein (DUF488 family)
MSDSLPIDESNQRSIWTIGHSNRSLEEFIALLQGAGIEQVVDVRRFPGSRKHPQFGQNALRASLAQAQIAYQHLPDLGGRRHTRRGDSPNTGWRVEAFSAYADYMATADFETALGSLEREANARRTAIMCSEAVPWRCHRRLIADALIVRGWKVFDIINPGSPKAHSLTPFAVVEGRSITYPDKSLF